MILHFHHSLGPNSGDVKRISNIDREFSNFYNDKTIEVVFCPSRKLGRVKGKDFFKLSENTKKKYCIPLIPHANRLNPYYESLILTLLCLIHRPKVIIGEMFFPKKLVEWGKIVCPHIKVFADIHGAVVDENLYVNPSINKKKLDSIRETDQYTTQAADYVLCQSDEMKRYIESNYDVLPEKICVYRCGYDANLFKLNNSVRLQTRKELGIGENDILFVYSGGLHKWQKVDDSLRLFNNYHHYNSKSKMLILTGDGDMLSEMMSQEEFSSIRDAVISTSVPFQSVPAYLNACDVAFLIRDNHVMNAVASPTKLAEYLACGLPVISSEVSKYWVEHEAEEYLLMADSKSINEDIDDVLSQLNKNNIASYAINHLSLNIDRLNIKKFLQTIEK